MRTVLICLCILLLLSCCAAAQTICEIKCNCKDGDIVASGGVVTANLSASISEPCAYIRDEHCPSGIKLRGFPGYEGVLYGFMSDGATYGLRVQTDSDGEKELVYLPNTPVCNVWLGKTPVECLDTRCVGGGPLCYDPTAGTGQCGVEGCCGVNNVGLLIKTSGRVTNRNVTKSCFYIDDGAHRSDGTGPLGVRVSYADYPAGGPYLIPSAGDFVVVTGVSSIFKDAQGKVRSVIRLRRQSDIVWYQYH